MSWKLAVTPTDTVYGLVSKLEEPAINKIYELKGRAKDKPLILFADSVATLKKYSLDWDTTIEKIVNRYWPGALTLVMKRSEHLPDFVNPHSGTIGMRIPGSPAVMKLINETEEKALMSTSANLSGEKSIANYEDAKSQFESKVDLIVKPGDHEVVGGLESTIISYIDGKFEVLREGALDKPDLMSQIQESL